MERFEEEEHEPYASITRLVSRLRISRDKATILLILYNWNEQKFDTEFLLSQEYATISSYFVNNPSFNVDLTNCKICNAMDLCNNLGCGHYICNTCFQEFGAELGAGESNKQLIGMALILAWSKIEEILSR